MTKMSVSLDHPFGSNFPAQISLRKVPKSRIIYKLNLDIPMSGLISVPPELSKIHFCH
jgi:hypothetical protein